jgi:ribonuclease BN (tRNA processing enzyme)
MIVTTLGTSHGDHTYCRFNSSTLIEVGEQLYLIDAGAPVEALLIRKQKRFSALQGVFITHMHGDHIGGLPGLIKLLLKYEEPGQHTDIFLPDADGVPALTAWLQAMYLDLAVPAIDVDITAEGAVYSNAAVQISAVGTQHIQRRIMDQPLSFAYIIDAEGKRIVYTGDVHSDFSDFPSIARHEPCDLCVCEATHYDMAAALPILADCPIGKLVFNHIGNQWHGDGEQRLQKMVDQLPFPCAIAHDGNEFEV